MERFELSRSKKHLNLNQARLPFRHTLLKWRLAESNCRLLQCKWSALPTELNPLKVSIQHIILRYFTTAWQGFEPWVDIKPTLAFKASTLNRSVIMLVSYYIPPPFSREYIITTQNLLINNPLLTVGTIHNIHYTTL